MVMRFRSGGQPSCRFHLGAMAPSNARPVAVAIPASLAEAEPERERDTTTWFTSSLELRDGLEVCELSDDSIDRIVL